MASRLKRSNCRKWIFFLKNNKILIYLLFPFILQNLKRILRADPESSGCAIFIEQNFQKVLTVDPKLWGCPIFGPKMVHLPQTFFFEKLLISFSSISPFHYPKFQKNPSSRSRVMWMCNFWTKNCPFAQLTYLLVVSSLFSTHSGLECILLCHRSDDISPFGSVTSQRDI